MKKEETLLDKEIVRKMLFHDEKYIYEFCNAALVSFSEFQNKFRKHLLARETTELRKAGHKIKPIATMLQLHPIVTLYEESKEMLLNDISDQALLEHTQKMDFYCNRILKEFREFHD